MRNRLFFVTCALLMVILGTSDALRGIFSPLFLSSYGFSESMVGVIVSASYLGNLIFLLLGGTILDKFGIKRSMALFMALMALSLVLLLFGHVYALLIIGFFLTLGLSTLLNTSINIASDSFSTSNSLSYLNILFFVQGIGTSGSQLLLSPYSESLNVWKITLIALSSLMIPLLIMLSRVKIEKREEEEEKREGNGSICYKMLVLLILSLSFYTIAEHGVTNYIISYGIAIGKNSGDMGIYLALYSLGIMSGRLILGSLISKTGAERMLLSSLILGSIAFILIFYSSILALTLLAGFAISTFYPTIVAYSRHFVPPEYASRATAIVVSLASIFDIIFNFSFGFVIERIGFFSAMKALAIAIILSLVFAIPLFRRKRA